MKASTLLLGALAVALPILTTTQPAAAADDWKTKYKEIVFASIPAENASGVMERYQPFADYLAKELGVKVTVRVASDYTAVIEGQKAGNIHIAYYGPASFSQAYVQTDGGVEPIVGTINSDGSKGYYSVLYVKPDSPYKTVEDLRGKKLGMVDPESTSGYVAPSFFLKEQGIDRDKFFSEAVITGSHENAVLALVKGDVDGAVNWWNGPGDSNYDRMVTKKMVPPDAVRIIWKSPLLPSSPYAVLTSLPDDMKAAIKKAFVEANTKDKAAFDKLSDGKDLGFFDATVKDYEAVIRMNKWISENRKKS